MKEEDMLKAKSNYLLNTLQAYPETRVKNYNIISRRYKFKRAWEYVAMHHKTFCIPAG
jgi:hypothetical protein